MAMLPWSRCAIDDRVASMDDGCAAAGSRSASARAGSDDVAGGVTASTAEARGGND
jgi:hypothetical protein